MALNYSYPNCTPNKSPITVWSGGRLGIKLSWLYETAEERAFRDVFQRKLKEDGLPYQFDDRQHPILLIHEWSYLSDRLLNVLQASLKEKSSKIPVEVTS